MSFPKGGYLWSQVPSRGRGLCPGVGMSGEWVGISGGVVVYVQGSGYVWGVGGYVWEGGMSRG